MIHSPLFLRRWPFLHRLVASAIRRYATLFHHRYMVERRMGVMLLLDQKNAVDKHLLYRGVWEPMQIEVLSRTLAASHRADERLVLLDIGSHGALYPLVLRSKIAFDEIVAFEPVPANLAQLRANLSMNCCSSCIEVVDAAVSDKRDVVRFVVAADKNRGMSRLADGDMMMGETLIEVSAITIDSFREYQNCLIAAKIDVEGGEMRVLRGMLQTLQRNRCLLQIEQLGDPSEVVGFLRESGYSLVDRIGPDYFFSNFHQRA